MAFFNRLFNRKGKTEIISGPQLSSLRRSLTDPQTSTSLPIGYRPSSDEKETVEGPRGATARPRRAGCDFTRSKTSVDVGSVRNSNASSIEPVCNGADGGKNQYRQLKALHRSRLHTIMAAQDRINKRSVVFKTVLKFSSASSSVRAKLESEVLHLRALAGVPGVVQFIQQIEDDDSVHIVLERCSGLTLIELIANSGGRLPEHVMVADVLIPLILVVCDLHRRGLVHRQIKPEHTLCQVESGQVTLVDFSEAVNKTQRCLNNRAGSLEYMAPEVLNKPSAEEVFHQVLYNGMSEEELPQYDEKADDMGRIQRELLTQLDSSGCPLLFANRSPQLSVEAHSFLMQALQLDPINRSSAERLLQHPLIQRYWPRFQVKHPAMARVPSAAAALAMAPFVARGNAAASPPPPQSGILTIPPLVSSPLGAAGKGQAIAVTVAAAAAAAATASRTAAGGVGGCIIPVETQKHSLLTTAAPQFPVR